MTPDEMKARTKEFAVRCLVLTTAYPKSRAGNHVADQLMRCSSSVAANYRAACLAQSKAAFVAKLSIVIEEVDEAAFWIEFALDADMITNKNDRLSAILLQEAKELTAMFIASRKTSRNSQ